MSEIETFLAPSAELMAFELVEYAFTHMPVQALLDMYTDQWQDSDPIDKAMVKARRNLVRHYTSLPESRIRKEYADMTGNSVNYVTETST